MTMQQPIYTLKTKNETNREGEGVDRFRCKGEKKTTTTEKGKRRTQQCPKWCLCTKNSSSTSLKLK